MGQFVDKGLLLAGDVYIAEVLSAGVYGPLYGPINVTKLEFTPPTTEEKNRLSNKKSSFGQALDSVQVAKDPAKLGITWDSATKSLLADAVGGKATTYTQSVVPFTDEAITLSQEGYVELIDQNLDTADWTVKKASDGTTVLTEGVDYEVNRDMGLIKALNANGAVAVLVSGKTKAATGTRIAGATEITKPRRVLVDGINLATNEKVRVTAHQVTFSATGATDLMSGEFIEGELEGTLVTPAGKDAPWEMIVIDAA